MKKIFIFIIVVLLTGTELLAQKTVSSFMGTSLITLPSTRQVDAENLELKFNHRFGNAKGETANFLGMENGASISISADYGLTQKLSLGIAKMSQLSTYESRAKYLLYEKSSGFPLTLSLYGAVGYESKKKEISLGPILQNPPTTGIPIADAYISVLNTKEEDLTPVQRMSYLTSVLLSSRITEKISLQLTPMYVHRNFVKTSLANDRMGLGIGGRIKLTKRIDLTFEGIVLSKRDYKGEIYATEDAKSYGGDKTLTGDEINNKYNSSNGLAYSYLRNVTYDQPVAYYKTPFSIGLDMEVGGHVFQLMVTNNRTLAHTQLLRGADYDLKKGDYAIGFNISRIFSFEDESKLE